ncbi:MAG TPA: ABC transporter substrate-binding protein [Nitriliruptorales bacterium]|nr:ABC transporter substrate-binding protein [Nitriliruptorales bacterium]
MEADTATPAEGAPSGTVRGAYPEEPGVWHPALGEQPAAIDLAALWGLPLYRVDGDGQLRPGLVDSARVLPGRQGPWEVELELRAGRWTDGAPVVADDLVATFAALRAVGGRHLGTLRAVTATGRHRVVLAFERPDGRWPHLLAEELAVLPAHVLQERGLEAYRSGAPVSGGPFRLASYEPGLRAVFVAHRQGPLGPPGVERVEVYFTPSYETALGLLQERRVEVALGYLALNPIERAERLDDVRAAAPLGGTWTLLRWRDGGTVGADAPRRHSARDVIDVGELVEGLLGGAGAPQTSTVPGVAGPWQPVDAPAAALDGVAVDLLLPAVEEALGATARVLQRHLRGAGAEVALVRLDADDVARRAPTEGDGALVVRRDGPRPSLLARAPPGATPETLAVLEAADAAGTATSDAMARAQQQLHDAAWERPLYRIAVAHAWHERLLGVAPSAWPGLALWDVGRWRWGPGGAPPQQPTVQDGDG